ncbi:MAG: BCCT family transporter [Xanthomonadales bacterium]|nr:BCCT family transporter [Xanthomonadales bacterium]
MTPSKNSPAKPTRSGDIENTSDTRADPPREINATDWWTFSATALTIVLFCGPLLLAPEVSAQVIQQAYAFLTDQFGVFYLWYGVGALAFLLYLAFGRFGRVRLGPIDSRPAYPTLSWVAMLFSTGIGAGLLYWAVIEWGYYYDAPPFGVEPRSPQAAEWASSYGLFHWGVLAWAFYCLPTLAIAYAFYVRGVPYLRLSTGCTPYLPGGVNSRRGRFIDFLFMINLIGGTGTSLGLSTPMIAASLAEVTGLSHDFSLEVAVVVLCIGIFGTSAWLGLDRGIKRLSDFNLYLALGLLFFVLAVGPSLFILKTGTNSIGLVLQNFLRMSTWTDPFTSSRFVEDWTVFYWAWWVAYGPFVGIFVTRISYGRTLREVIGGMLVFGSLGAALFFIVFGNYALHLELEGLLSVTSLMKEAGAETAIASVFASLPLGALALSAFFLMAVVFLATTYDSASFTLASVATRRLHAGESPARWHRLFWAVALGILPVTLMFVDGGLTVVLSTTIVVSLPLLLVGILLARSLLLQLREDHPPR